MGDRIAIMRDGVLEQVGDPGHGLRAAREHVRRELHRQPGDEPRARRLRAPQRRGAAPARRRAAARARRAGDVPADVIVGVRPEHTRLWESEAGLLGPIDGTVEYVEALGRETLIGVEAAGAARFVVEADGRVRAEPGESLRFGLRRGWVYLFDSEHRAGDRPDLAGGSVRRVRSVNEARDKRPDAERRPRHRTDHA